MMEEVKARQEAREAGQVPRLSINAGLRESGESRDEYDSAVRNGYRERLEQAERDRRIMMTGGIGPMMQEGMQTIREENGVAKQEKPKQEKKRYGGSWLDILAMAGGADTTLPAATVTPEAVKEAEATAVGGTLAGASKDYLGSLVSGAGTLMQTASKNNPANQAAQIIANMQGTDAPEVVKSAAEKEAAKNEATAKNAQTVRQLGKNISAAGQAQMQRAKVGQSARAQAALDVLGTGSQMVMDIGLGALTNLGMMVPMAARVFGSSAEKAADKGASLEQQVTYGIAAAGVAYAVEKITNVAFKGLKIVNPGIADDVLEKVINKMAQKLASGPKGATVLKTVASLATAAGGEGLEEFLEALIDPYLQRMTYDKDAKSIFQDPELMSEALYSAFLGGVLGGIGGNVNLSINTILETGENEDLRKAYQQYLSFYTDEAVNEAYAAMKENGMFSNEAAEAMKKTNQKLQRMMPKTEQRAAQNRAGITVAAQVDEKGENKAVGAVEGAGNTETHPTQETEQSGKISEAETGVQANAQTRAENLRVAEQIIAAKDEKAMADIIMQGVNAGRNTEAHRHAAEIAEKIAGRKLPTAEELSVQMELNATESVEMDGQTEPPAVNWEKYPNLQKLMNGDPGVDSGKLASEARAALQNGDLTLDDGTAVKEETAPAATEAAEAVSTEPAPVMAGQEGAEYAGEDRVSGDRGRRAGAAAGEPGRRVAQGTGRRQNREVQNIRGRSRADDVSFAYEHAGAEPVSTKDLYGDERGSEEADLREAPRSVIESDEELRGLDSEIRQAGYEPHFFTGMARLKSGQPCPAYFDGKRVFIRIDHPKWTATELWDHEKFHGIKDKDPGIVDRIWTHLAKTTDREQLQNTLKVYRDRYHGAYDVDAEGDTVWNVDVMQKIVEEILADAYAGRDAFGTGVEDYTETVREMAGQTEEETAEARGPPEGRFAFAGENARTADLDALARAKEMDAQEIAAETIRQETGWFKGMDGKWRFEIDDSKMRYERRGDLGFRRRHEGYNRYRELNGKAERSMLGLSEEQLTAEEQQELTDLRGIWGNTFRTDGRVAPDALSTTKLTDYIDHPAVFEAYPELESAALVFEDLPEGTRGQYDRDSNTIRVSEKLRSAPEETLLHEIQHAIQAKEGFTGGSSPEYWAAKEAEMGSVTLAEKRYINMYKALTKEQANQWTRYKELDRVLSELFLVEGKEAEYERYERKQDELYDELYENEWFRDMLDADRYANDSQSYYENLYRNTAGEIEARDVADRRKLTTEERKKTAPNMGGKNTVFAEKAGWSRSEYDPENATIKEQLENSREMLNEMKVAASVTVPTEFKGKKDATKWAVELLKKTGYKVENQEYGVIRFNPDDINNALNYADTDAEKAAIAALPGVLKRGKEIGRHKNHKMRNKETYTLAAPVELNGQKGHMAVVVAKYKNHYETHRIVLPDGSVFKFSEKNKDAAQEPSRGGAVNSSLAETTSATSSKTVPQQKPEVKGSFAVDAAEESAEQPWWIGEAEEIRKAAEMMAERNRRDPAFDVDEYLQRKRQEAEAERARRLRNVPKTEFEGTEAMNKLGIRVEGSVANYAAADQIRKRHSAARSIKKELRKAEKRLGSTAEERIFAGHIAGGTLTEGMIPDGVRRDVVMELADYYMAERAQGIDMIREKRAEINRTLDERMANLFKDTDKYDPSPIIVLNNRTPQRNMLKIFGDKMGKKINEEIFDPVATNEAERLRFINRQLDQVRTFADSTGKQSRLNKDERALVQMMIEGRAVEEIVAGMEMGGAIQRLGKSIAEGADNGDGPQAVGLNGKERDLAKKYARWLQAQEALQSDSVDSVKVANAADKYSQLFDQYYDAINDFLVVHGYEPIGFIKGYAPHLQPEDNMDLLDKTLQAMGLNRSVTNLPTEIAGRTSEFKPSKRWNPYFLSRTGDETRYDIAEAFESYVDHLSDVLYHTDDIMRLRRMELFFRKAYSKEELGEQIDWAEHLREMKPEERLDALRDAGLVGKTTSLSPEDMAEVIEKYVEENFAKMEDVTKYGEFVVWLQNYANILAGKQSMVDRGGEAGAGRRILNWGNRLTSMFGKAQVAGNLSSVLNQTSQLSMILAENGTRNTLRAARDMMKGDLRRAFADESDVLTGKAGIKFLVQTPGEMIIDTMFTPAQWMDTLVSSLAVRGAYLKAVKAGMSHEDAMKAADRYGRNVMGSREKGVKPLGFHAKNPLSQLLHVFQVEALNNWEHVSQDLPHDFRQIAEENGKKKAAAALAGVIIKTLLSAFLLNRLTEETYGGTPAPFDILGMSSNFIASGRGLSTNEWLMKVIDDGIEQLTGERSLGTERMDRSEFDTEAAVADLGYNISNEIPFLSNASSLLGLGDQTLPWPDLFDTGKDLIDAVREDGLLSGSTAQAAAGVAGEFLPGGRQMVKTIGGIQSAVRGGKATGYGDDMALQFPTEQSPGNIARQVLFGVNATPEARSYWASGNSKMSTKQTQLWKRLKDGGADSEDVYDTIHAWREVTANKELDSLTRSALQRNMVRHMDMTDDQKLDMYRTLSGADSRCDKFQRMMDAGMTFDQVMDAYERHEELDNDESLKASDKAAQFVQWAYMELDRDAANAAITELAFYTTMKAAPSQAALEEQLNQTSLTNAQKAAIWDSYGWKKMSPWG
jgi:hypothetical protein